MYIYIYSHFLFLAILYLADDFITMPSPRNHSLGFLIRQPALSGNGQSAKCKLSATTTSLVPEFKIQSSAAAAAEFLILLATIPSLIPKFETQNSAAPAAEL